MMGDDHGVNETAITLEPLMSPANNTHDVDRDHDSSESGNGVKSKGLHVQIVDEPTRLGGSAASVANGSDEKDDSRATWGGKMEFIFTCIGYAVGLGNVWRFPFLAYKNGGGAFLLPYVLMLALVGLPLFFMELAFGQFASLGPITIWKISPLFKGLGYAMVIVSWLIGIYYNVIISHVLLYLFASIASIAKPLPWTSCDNSWNTPFCLDPQYAREDSSNATNITEVIIANHNEITTTEALSSAVTAAVNATGKYRTPAEEYYKYFVLEMSDGIDDSGVVNWKLALCLLLAWIIVLFCLIRGIQSLGKVVYFTAIFPYLMLTILLVRGASLPGAAQGIIFYLKPDFSRLADSRVWCDAATQIFYSLSACSGGLIAMSSYNKFHNNCLQDALIVALVNCGTSIYAGFVIFSVLGFMALEKGVPVSEVADGGPGLAFEVYPEAISRMPVPQMWAIFFFIMMATLGFGSQFSIVEGVLSAFTDEFAQYLRGRKIPALVFRAVFMFSMFLLGLPMVTRGGIYLLNLVDYSVSGFPLLIIGFLECTVINWLYGYSRFSDDIEIMLGKRINYYWKACWLVVTPLIIGVTVIFNCIYYKPPSLDDYVYPPWANSLGWLIGLFPILVIPAYFLYRYCLDGGYELLKELLLPVPEWGPSQWEDRSNLYALSVPLTPSRMDVPTKFTFEDYSKAFRKPEITIKTASSNESRIFLAADKISRILVPSSPTKASSMSSIPTSLSVEAFQRHRGTSESQA